MAKIGQLNVEAARLDPERHFASPLDIVSEPMLTRGEKLATLERWKLQIYQQLDAGSEGMRTVGTSAVQTDVLDKIEEARRKLEEPDGGR
ncbi:MAG: hypothetical protein AB7U18_27050 [Dehalococcoidia bacterium]|jgi:hypothetical protein